MKIIIYFLIHHLHDYYIKKEILSNFSQYSLYTKQYFGVNNFILISTHYQKLSNEHQYQRYIY